MEMQNKILNIHPHRSYVYSQVRMSVEAKRTYYVICQFLYTKRALLVNRQNIDVVVFFYRNS